VVKELAEEQNSNRKKAAEAVNSLQTAIDEIMEKMDAIVMLAEDQ
jgi:nucleoid DNA-binding protein